MKFTGHERDDDPAGGNNPLDYMHARYYDGAMARFLSMDVVGSTPKEATVAWNCYAYAADNPLQWRDANGLWIIGATDFHKQIATTYAKSATFRSVYDAVNHNPNVVQQLTSGWPIGSDRAETKIVPSQAAGLAVKTTIPPKPQSVNGPAIGHEIQHGAELAQYGSIRKAPGAYQNFNAGAMGYWETTVAKAIEAQIADEVKESKESGQLTPAQELDVFGPSQRFDHMDGRQQGRCATDPSCFKTVPPVTTDQNSSTQSDDDDEDDDNEP
jgi:RHS repeat-associated protein